MWYALTVGVLAAALTAPQTDKTVAVQRGMRLEVSNYGGEIVVRTWDQDAVRIQAMHSERDQIDIKSTESTLSVRGRATRGPTHLIDFELTVPAWIKLDLSGTYTDVSVEGVASEVAVKTVEGEIRVRGGAEFISLKSVEGKVTLEQGRGRIEVHSVSEAVQIRDCSGEISADTVDGDIQLQRIDSDRVDVSTVDGDLVYEGAIHDQGRYRFSSHDGDITVVAPEDVNAAVSVATFDGEFETTFHAQVTELRKGRRFSMTLGSGSARLELESFDGSIRLQRPGDPREPQQLESEQEE